MFERRYSPNAVYMVVNTAANRGRYGVWIFSVFCRCSGAVKPIVLQQNWKQFVGSAAIQVELGSAGRWTVSLAFSYHSDRSEMSESNGSMSETTSQVEPVEAKAFASLIISPSNHLISCIVQAEQYTLLLPLQPHSASTVSLRHSNVSFAETSLDSVSALLISSPNTSFTAPFVALQIPHTTSHLFLFGILL